MAPYTVNVTRAKANGEDKATIETAAVKVDAASHPEAQAKVAEMVKANNSSITWTAGPDGIVSTEGQYVAHIGDSYSDDDKVHAPEGGKPIGGTAEDTFAAAAPLTATQHKDRDFVRPGGPERQLFVNGQRVNKDGVPIKPDGTPKDGYAGSGTYAEDRAAAQHPDDTAAWHEQQQKNAAIARQAGGSSASSPVLQPTQISDDLTAEERGSGGEQPDEHRRSGVSQEIASILAQKAGYAMGEVSEILAGLKALRLFPRWVELMSQLTDNLDAQVTRLGNITTVLGTDITSAVTKLQSIGTTNPDGSVVLTKEEAADLQTQTTALSAVGDTLTKLDGQLKAGSLPGTVTSPVTGQQTNTDTGAAAGGAKGAAGASGSAGASGASGATGASGGAAS